MASKWSGTMVFPLESLLLLTMACTARRPHTWIFYVRSLFLFLLPSGKLVTYPLGVKSYYGAGSSGLSEDLCFWVSEWSTSGGGLAWSTIRTSKGRLQPSSLIPASHVRRSSVRQDWRCSGNPVKEAGGSSKK